MPRLLRATSVIVAVLLATTNVQAQATRWWKGNLHTHSLWSDGVEYPEMIVAWYRDHDYNFLALTEHDLLQHGERWLDVNAADPGWPPRNASARKALDAYRARFGSDVDERREGNRHLVRLRPLAEYRSQFEAADRFLLLTAEEITDRGGAHVNALNITEAIKPHGGIDQAARIRANLAAVDAQRAATRRPIVAIVNHPNFTWALTAEEIAAIPNARFFEVRNGHTMTNSAGDTLHANTERIWDVILALRHSGGGEPIYGVATDDAHDFGANSDTISRPGRGWVMVRAPALAADDLMRSLDRGDFYASTGVTLRDIEIDDRRIRIEIAAEPGVTYRTQFIGTLRNAPLEGGPVIGPDGAALRTTRTYDPAVGRVLAEVDGTVAEYTFRGTERYVRARVIASRRQRDPTTGKALGPEMAWVQPVFRERGGTGQSGRARS